MSAADRSSRLPAPPGRPRGAFAARCAGGALMLLSVLCAFAADPKSVARRSVSLMGVLTNTTADVAGEARLELSIEGEKATATLKTEAPLSGSGRLEGSFRNGWLELTGKLAEGFTLQLRGALNTRDFRGTYIAAIAGEPVQYGKFQLARPKP